MLEMIYIPSIFTYGAKRQARLKEPLGRTEETVDEEQFGDN